MKKRALIHIGKKISFWAIKQVLTSLPVVGFVFKLALLGVELVRELKQVIAEADAVPQLALAMS